MEPITATMFMGIVLLGVMAFVGWLVRQKFTQVDDHENRLTKVEAKTDVLKEIFDSLQHVRTDVEVIKSKVENLKDKQ